MDRELIKIKESRTKEEICEAFESATLVRDLPKGKMICNNDVRVVEAKDYIILTTKDKIVEEFGRLEVLRQSENSILFERGNVTPVLDYTCKATEVRDLIEEFSETNPRISAMCLHNTADTDLRDLSATTLVLATRPEILLDYARPFAEIHQKSFPQESVVTASIRDVPNCITSIDTTINDSNTGKETIAQLLNELQKDCIIAEIWLNNNESEM